MATLSVWRFATAAGAEGALDTLKELQRQELIQVHDAAVVTWEEGRKKPKTKHLADMTGPGGARRRLLGAPLRPHLLRPAVRPGRGRRRGRHRRALHEGRDRRGLHHADPRHGHAGDLGPVRP